MEQAQLCQLMVAEPLADGEVNGLDQGKPDSSQPCSEGAGK